MILLVHGEQKMYCKGLELRESTKRGAPNPSGSSWMAFCFVGLYLRRLILRLVHYEKACMALFSSEKLLAKRRTYVLLSTATFGTLRLFSLLD